VLTDGIVHDLTELVISSKELWHYFAEITHSSLGHINIKLCRPHCFAFCIGEVAKTANAYGTSPSVGDRLYLFTHDLSISKANTGECKSKYHCTEFHKLLDHSATKARGVLLTSLLHNLLMAAGYTVTICNTSDTHSDDETLFKSLFFTSKTLPYISNPSAENSSPNVHCIDVGKYLSERNLVGQKLPTNANCIAITTKLLCGNIRKRWIQH